MIVYTPDPGYDWNPLKRHRNLPCPCGSGQKVKRCHGMAEMLPLEDIKKVKAWLLELARAGFIKTRLAEIG